jgi:hypothetical protein
VCLYDIDLMHVCGVQYVDLDGWRPDKRNISSDPDQFNLLVIYSCVLLITSMGLTDIAIHYAE